MSTFSLVGMVEPVLSAMVIVFAWLVVGGLGAALWNRDLRLPGGLLIGAALGGLLARFVSFCIALGWRFVLPESYSTLEGGLLTPERVMNLLSATGLVTSMLGLVVMGTLGATLFVGRGPVEGEPP